MTRYYFLLLFFSFSVLFSFAQKEPTRISSISKSNEGTIDITTFIVNGFTYKRVEEKKDNNRLRLAVRSEKLFVVDSLGAVQPYIIDNFDCSLSVKGGGIEIYSCVDNIITAEILSMIAKSDIGSKIFFDNVVVRDSDRKSHKDIIRPLVIQRVK